MNYSLIPPPEAWRSLRAVVTRLAIIIFLAMPVLLLVYVLFFFWLMYAEPWRS